MQPIEISAHNKLKIPKLKKNKSMIMLFAINIKIDFNLDYLIFIKFAYFLKFLYNLDCQAKHIIPRFNHSSIGTYHIYTRHLISLKYKLKNHHVLIMYFKQLIN